MDDPNRANLESIVRSLGEMNDELVYVGGVIAGLLITDSAAATIRATKDVDCIIDVSTRSDYDTRVRSLLLERGFSEMIGEGIPICAWEKEGLRLDVMPTDDSLGFTNPWYRGAIDNSNQLEISERIIKIISSPYFLATKFAAFQSRGQDDYWTSHDLEDIIAVIDGRPEIVSEVSSADAEVKRFLTSELNSLLSQDDFLQVLPGFVLDEGRGPIVLERIRSMVEGRSDSALYL
ncbi:MAG: hypothetical protein BMS9Abin05_2506 [Rhodothermia bacterium]|nr:MAG: hypothetical protein BMS9Abin05_2506 [Rhodothermia bacterium]